LIVLGFLAGLLACLDGFMNIALEQTEEYVNGHLKNKYGDAFIRGNNGQDRFHSTSAPSNPKADNLSSAAVLYISMTRQK
jgi:hypothetical protein